MKHLLLATMVSMVAQLQATTFPLYVQSLGGNLVIAGLMTSVYMGTSASCKPFVGKLLNNSPRKKLFFIFGIIFAIILSSFGFMNVVLMIRVVNVSLRPLFIRGAKVRNNLVIRHKTLQNIPDIWWSRQKSVPLRSIWK